MHTAFQISPKPDSGMKTIKDNLKGGKKWVRFLSLFVTGF